VANEMKIIKKAGYQELIIDDIINDIRLIEEGKGGGKIKEFKYL
jgi:hypothetical protein